MGLGVGPMLKALLGSHHKFCATNTTTQYQSRHCKENSILSQIDITRAKVMVVLCFTKNIHKFFTTKTTTHYYSKHCKENSIPPQIDIKFALFS